MTVTLSLSGTFESQLFGVVESITIRRSTQMIDTSTRWHGASYTPGLSEFYITVRARDPVPQSLLDAWHNGTVLFDEVIGKLRYRGYVQLIEMTTEDGLARIECVGQGQLDIEDADAGAIIRRRVAEIRNGRVIT